MNTTGSSDPEDPEAGFIRFEGFSFLPTSAAISLFATTSIVLTVLTASSLSRGMLAVMGAFLFAFFVAALLASALGFVSLLLRGLGESGTLAIGGMRLSETPLGVVFLFCYAAPWLMAAFWFCKLSQELR